MQQTVNAYMPGEKFKLFVLSTPFKPLIIFEKSDVVVYNIIIINYESAQWLTEWLNKKHLPRQNTL